MRTVKHYRTNEQVEVKGRVLHTNAGTHDELHTFQEGNELFVLAVNEYLPYIGLEVYTPDSDYPNREVFFQEESAEEFMRYVPINQAKILNQHTGGKS